MQVSNLYLNDQIVNVNLTTSVFVPNREKKMYASPLQLYRGVDNTIKFNFKNNDQKKVLINDKTITFNIIDSSTHITHLTRTMTIEDGANGIAKLVISEADLNDINVQYYTWSVSVIDGENNQHIGYHDTAYTAGGELKVHEGVYPNFVESTMVTFTGNTTPAIHADPRSNNNAALHTAQLYFDEAYTGSVTIQGTMDDVVNSVSVNYFDISTTVYTAETSPTYLVWNGVYSGIRFVKSDTTGTITNILYRY